MSEVNADWIWAMNQFVNGCEQAQRALRLVIHKEEARLKAAVERGAGEVVLEQHQARLAALRVSVVVMAHHPKWLQARLESADEMNVENE